MIMTVIIDDYNDDDDGDDDEDADADAGDTGDDERPRHSSRSRRNPQRRQEVSWERSFDQLHQSQRNGEKWRWDRHVQHGRLETCTGWAKLNGANAVLSS